MLCLAVRSVGIDSTVQERVPQLQGWTSRIWRRIVREGWAQPRSNPRTEPRIELCQQQGAGSRCNHDEPFIPMPRISSEALRVLQATCKAYHRPQSNSALRPKTPGKVYSLADTLTQCQANVPSGSIDEYILLCTAMERHASNGLRSPAEELRSPERGWKRDVHSSRVSQSRENCRQ